MTEAAATDIFEVHNYTDDKGKNVQQIKPVFMAIPDGCVASPASKFIGSAIVVIPTPRGDHPLRVSFPIAELSVQDCFKNFEKHLEQYMEAQRQAAEKAEQEEAAKPKLVLPDRFADQAQKPAGQLLRFPGT